MKSNGVGFSFLKSLILFQRKAAHYWFGMRLQVAGRVKHRLRQVVFGALQVAATTCLVGSRSTGLGGFRNATNALLLTRSITVVPMHGGVW